MNNDMKQVKFEMLIDDINDSLANRVDLAYVLSFMKVANIMNRRVSTPLNIIFNKEESNKYGEIILSKVNFNISEWAELYGDKDLSNTDNKINATKKLVILLRKGENRSEAIKLIFWSLFIIAVDKNDYDEKVSIISDLAYMININDKILVDIITAVKMVMGEAHGCAYYTNEVREFVSGLPRIS